MGEKTTTPQGLLLRMLTGPKCCSLGQIHMRKKRNVATKEHYSVEKYKTARLVRKKVYYMYTKTKITGFGLWSRGNFQPSAQFQQRVRTENSKSYF